jgi:hypothetical protein
MYCYLMCLWLKCKNGTLAALAAGVVPVGLPVSHLWNSTEFGVYTESYKANFILGSIDRYTKCGY